LLAYKNFSYSVCFRVEVGLYTVKNFDGNGSYVADIEGRRKRLLRCRYWRQT